MKFSGIFTGIIITAMVIAGAVAAIFLISPKPSVSPSSSPSSNPSRTVATIVLPTLDEATPVEFAGLHNVVAYHEGFLSGAAPEGTEGFDTLATMGVRTIISVDGAAPDVEEAKARGLKYIHLPIGYNGFDEQRKLELVRATRDALAEGPVYIHCHHGKHRSAGAAGAVAVSLGWLTSDEGIARMKVSGTAPNYMGLYECTAESTLLDQSVIDAVPADFPEVSQPATFVKAMVELDHVNDHLKAIEKAGWRTPADHPDLVPVAEAGRMVDLFRLIEDSEKTKANPADFVAQMIGSDRDRAQIIEDMLASDAIDVAKLSEQFKAIQASCKECHAKYRD